MSRSGDTARNLLGTSGWEASRGVRARSPIANDDDRTDVSAHGRLHPAGESLLVGHVAFRLHRAVPFRRKHRFARGGGANADPARRRVCDVDGAVSGAHPRREDVRLGRGDLRLPAAARLRAGGGGDRRRRRGGHHLLAHVGSLDEPPRQPAQWQHWRCTAAAPPSRCARAHLPPEADARRHAVRAAASHVARLFRGRHAADGVAHQAEARRTRAAAADLPRPRVARRRVCGKRRDRRLAARGVRPVRSSR